jgi:hypothetical protein
MAATIAEYNDEGRVYENLPIRWRAAAIPGTDMLHSRDGTARASGLSVSALVGSAPVAAAGLLLAGLVF